MQTAEAFLACPRPINITAGSHVAAALPAPTALRKVVKPLTAGDKAGIAIGVIAGVVLIGGGLWCMLRKRRQQRKVTETIEALQAVEKKMKDEREALAEKKAPMKGGEGVYEAAGDARGEMQGTQTYTELEGTSTAGELDGRGLNHSVAMEH